MSTIPTIVTFVNDAFFCRLVLIPNRTIQKFPKRMKIGLAFRLSLVSEIGSAPGLFIFMKNLTRAKLC
jgi:hypothetical protein